MPNPSWDPAGSWTIVFDDEFDSDSGLNTTYWGAGWQGKTGITPAINSGSPENNSANVTFSGGYLNLTLTSSYGACITTNTNGTGGSAGFATGPPAAFEAYINVPGATSGSDVGIYNWPAFWNDGQSWPADGEIDVFEGLNGYAAYHVHDNTNPDGIGGNAGTLGDYTGWHTFGCYWQAGNTVTFYYDGTEVGSEATDGFTEPHFLILVYTTTPDAGDPVGTMLVDWARVWTPGGSPPPSGVTCSGGISFSPFGFSGSVNTGKSGSISVDPTTPPVVVATGSASTSMTTASFSPPANTLLAVLTSFEYQAGNASSPVFTVSDSVSGTYTAGPSVFDGTRGMTAAWSRYLYTAPGAMTVTVANSGVTATRGQILAVYVLDGANSIQAKAAAGTAHSGSATASWTGVISTTVPGSWVMLAGAGSAGGTITANASTVTLVNEQDATDKVSLLTARQIVPTGSDAGGGGSGTPAGGLYITTPALPTGQVSQAYTTTLAAAGGTGTGQVWTVSSGSLPGWATLNASTGVISGTPDAAAVTGLTVQVIDSALNTATQAVVMTTITGPSAGPSGSWTLAFADEFNVAYPTPYGTGPDPNVWSDHYSQGDLVRVNNLSEQQWFPHGYYGHSVANSVWSGTMVYQNPQSFDPTCPSPLQSGGQAGKFTAGFISGHLSNSAFTYGYTEARVLQAAPASSWSAFWMLGRTGNWPPEIDIAEWQNSPSTAGENDNAYYNFSDTWQTTYYSGDSSEYHVYGCEVTSSTITYWRDGVVTATQAYDGTAVPWFPMGGSAVEGASSGSGYPASWNCDYIRIWVPAGVPAAPVITSVSPATGIASGGDITVSFTAVSGATSYRVTAQPCDAIADGYNPSANERFLITGTSSPITVTGLPANIRFNFTCCAVNSAGYSPESYPAGPQQVNIQVSTLAVPNAVAGTAYSQTLTATAGSPPYAWAVSSGSLPAGLTLSTAGVISGTPTAAGTSDFTVKASGTTAWSGSATVANSASQALSITVNAGSGGGGQVGPGNTTLGWTSSAAADYALAMLEVIPVIASPPPGLKSLRLQAVKRAASY